jgi:hypothetical protein
MTTELDHHPTPSEVADGIWRWTAPHPEWRNDSVPWTQEVASFALASDARLVLVDPLLHEDADAAAAVLERLDALVSEASSVAIVVTIPYHVRSSEELAERYADAASVTLHGHPSCARRLRRPGLLADITTADASLPPGMRVFGIGRRFETPVYVASHRALAFGDAIVGVAGELRVWESVGDPKRERWYRERFLPILRPLLEVDAEHVLVTHGPPVLHDGNAALEAALASPPWHYR